MGRCRESRKRQNPDLGALRLPQEGQLGSVLWTIGVFLGLDDRREIENSHHELRDVEQPSSFS